MNVLKAAGIAVHIVIAASLGACASGGGGGGGGSPPITPAPPSPPLPPPPPIAVPPLPPAAAPGSFPNSSSNEYNNNWGPEGIQADAAWQFENAHGEGVLIGVIDDGIVAASDPRYAELSGRISPNSQSINGLPLNSNNTHGAELSSIIAGNFNGGLTVGVAYEATILAVRADNGMDTFNSQDLANAVDYAVAQGVKVINFSLGGGAPSQSAFQAAIQRATEAGVIVVTSAGNDGPFVTQPNYPGFLATNPTVSNGLILIAGGLNANGTFNDRSNPAGSAAQYYLTAPGWEIVVPDYGAQGPLAGFQQCWPNPSANPCTSGLVEIQGTSYASPHVVGAIAILMSAFPGLTPQQVVAIILQTTDDMGAAGIDSQTGHGRLNLARAFQPIGTVSAPLIAGAPEITATTPLGAVGAAFGDGLTDDSGAWRMAGFDSFGRTYALDVGLNWLRAAPGPLMAAQAPPLWRSARTREGVAMQFAPSESLAPDSYRSAIDRAELEQASVRIDAALAPGLTLSFAANDADTRVIDAADAVGHLAFVEADESVRLTRAFGSVFNLSVMSESGEARVGLDHDLSERSAQAVQAGLRFHRAGLSVTYGRIREGQGVLGLVWADEFGETPGGDIRFAGLAGHMDAAPRLRLGFNAEFGVADLPPSWLTLAAPLRTTSFALEARYAATPLWFEALDAHGKGAVTLTLTQPLRVEDGALLVRLPSAGRFGRKSLTYEDRIIDVTPSGRELRLGLGYSYVEANALSVFGEALYVLEPGHVANAEARGQVRVGIRLRH